MVVTTPPLHPDLAPLALLLGEWEGEGRGRTGEGPPFTCREWVRFWHAGKPVILYTQRTASLDDGRPLHAEMGFWRPGPGRAVEFVVAHGIGVAEIELGTVEDGHLRLASASIRRTPTAKSVTLLERDIDVDGDELRYQLRMATDRNPPAFHLEGALHRTDR